MYSGRKVLPRFLRVVLTGFILFSLVIIYLMASIYKYSFVTEDVQADAAITLGAAVWEDSPSPVFKERINHAINLYKDGKVNYLIFTGGVGKNNELAESEVATIYAINQRVPEDIIFIETSSTITFENLKESKKIINEKEINSVLIVSDPVHMKRAMMMAKNLGITAYSSPTPTSRFKSWRVKVKFVFSEAYYYAGYILKNLITSVD